MCTAWFESLEKERIVHMCVCVCVCVCVSDRVCIDYQWLNPSLADTGSVPDVSTGYDKGIVHVHVRKAYAGNRGVFLLILKLADTCFHTGHNLVV